MPLTSDEKRQLVAYKGYDPDKFDINADETEVIPKELSALEQPSISSSSFTPVLKPQQPQFSQDNPLMTMLKSFGQEALPSVGAGLGGAGGIAAGSSIGSALGPIGTILGGLVGGVAGGFGGGKLTKMAQESVEPESWQQNVQLSQRQNPLSGIAGGIAALPLSGLNPSPTRLLEAGMTLPKLLTSGAKALGRTAYSDVPEAANLMNVGAGVGLGAGQSILQGGSGKDILLNALLGGVFNKPWALGKAYGFHDINTPSLEAQGANELTLNKQQPQEQSIPQQTQQALNTSAHGLPDNRGGLVSGPLRNVVERSDKMAGYVRTPEGADIQTFEGEGNPNFEKQEPTSGEKAGDFHLARTEQLLENEKIKAASINEHLVDQLAQENQHKQSQLQMKLGVKGTPESIMSRGIVGSEQKPKPLYYEQQGSKQLPIYDDLSTYPSKLQVTPEESAQDLEMRKLEGHKDKYQEASKIYTKEEQDFINNLKDQNLSAKPGWWTLMKDWIEKQKGLPVSLSSEGQAGRTTIYPTTGKPSGIELNLLHPESPKAGPDTAPHEAFHATIAALRNSNRPGDRRIVQRYDELVRQSDDYQKWAKERKAGGYSDTPEEYQATNAGYEFLKSMLNTRGEGKTSKWWNDYKSYLKTRFSEKNATVEDFQRMLDHRIKNDPRTIGSYFGDSSKGISPAATTKSSEESKLKPSDDDIKRYNEIQARMINLKSQKQFGDEFMRLWKESEQIKNKYEGFVPTREMQLSEESKLSQPNHPDIQRGIDHIVARTDDASITQSEADELHNALSGQVDWSKMPETKKALDNITTPDDKVDPYKWSFVKEAYNKEINAAKTASAPEKVTESPEQLQNQLNTELNQPEKVTEPVKKIETKKAESVPTQAAIVERKPAIVQQKFTPDEQAIFTKLERAEKLGLLNDPEFFNHQMQLRNMERHEILNTTEPKEVAKRLREKMRVNADRINAVESDPTSEAYKEAQRRNSDLQMKYKQLQQLHGTEEPKIEQVINPKYKLSEESKLRSAKGEGKTPYPFTLKELEKGSEVGYEVMTKPGTISDIHKLDQEKSIRQYNSLHNLYAPDRNSLNSDYSRFPVTKPQIEKIKELGLEGEGLAHELERFFPLKDNIYGKGMAPILSAAKSLSQKDFLKVENVLINESRDKKSYRELLNTKQEKLYDAVRDSLKQKQLDQIAAGQPVFDYKTGTYRLPSVDPFYYPHRIDPGVTDILMNPKEFSQAAKLKKDFIDYQLAHGVNAKDAQAKLNSIVTAYDEATPNLTSFNANRENSGIGLPDSWMRRGRMLQNLSSYYNRVSVDRAYHDTIEKNPDVADSLRLKNDPWGKPYTDKLLDISGDEDVRDVMKRIHGEAFDKSERKVKLLNRIATSLMLGPLTNIHIAGSSVANAMQYASLPQAVKGLTYALTHTGEGIQHAIQDGYIRKNLRPAFDLIDSQSSTLDRMSALADGIGNLSGRDAANKLTKGYLQAFGEYLVGQKAIEANSGSKESINLMKHIDPDWSSGKTYAGDDLQKVASNFAGLVHGSHDARTLPGWMLKDTAIQPFFQLASWNIAQTNQWVRHVWTPATQGNFTPLIMSTLGAAVGGYVIKNAREKIADKKSPIPSLQEIVDSNRGWKGNLPNIGYNLMAMGSYVGYAGILSVLGKAVEDVGHKNLPQGAAFPLDEVISNPVEHISQYISAATNDNNFDYIKSGTKMIGNVTKANFQLGRLVLSWLARSENIPGLEQEHYQKSLNAKEADLRRWKMVEGMPYEEQTKPESNPYLGGESKRFKRTSDIGEAVQELPTLVQKAFDTSNGNPDVLESKLKALKQNTYETMPSPSRMPLSFIRYLNFLSQTQGSEVASERYMDYMMKNKINKIKSELVPTF